MENKINKMNNLTTSLIETIRELEKALESESEANIILKIEDLTAIHQLELSKAFSDLRKSSHEKLRQLYPYEEISNNEH